MRDLSRIYGMGLGLLLLFSLGFLIFRGLFSSPVFVDEFNSSADSILLLDRASTHTPLVFLLSQGVDSSKVWVFKPVELNQATKSELISIRGIGDVFARRIIERRESLGGFIAKEQLMEIKGITSDKFSELEDKIFVDTAKIKKININFATRNTLVKHPYVSESMATRIIKGTKMKGVIVNYRQLIDNDILTPKEARKLAPYLLYDTIVHQD